MFELRLRKALVGIKGTQETQTGKIVNYNPFKVLSQKALQTAFKKQSEENATNKAKGL